MSDSLHCVCVQLFGAICGSARSMDRAGQSMDPYPVFTLVILPDARAVRERYASGCPCTHCVGFVRYTQPHREAIAIGRCSQWMRTVRVELALQCECSSERVAYASDAPSAHVCRISDFFPNH